MSTVGVAQLRQNLSKYLKLVANGDEFVVTDHNVPVARLVALTDAHMHLKVTPASRRVLPEPIRPGGGTHAISKALRELREES